MYIDLKLINNVEARTILLNLHQVQPVLKRSLYATFKNPYLRWGLKTPLNAVAGLKLI